ncbi:hypothetical protein C8R46DRAFT_1038648 [Mycena filopes]|nr:hypothetical protein C8R46DRAFT_1038648 [Mycena filopes]
MSLFATAALFCLVLTSLPFPASGRVVVVHDGDRDNRLSTGARIAIIVVSIVVAIALVVLVILFRRRQLRRMRLAAARAAEPGPVLPMSTMGQVPPNYAGQI